jgi:hypothetical protein
MGVSPDAYRGFEVIDVNPLVRVKIIRAPRDVCFLRRLAFYLVNV